ncbi:MAG: branched-chain amino acid ABC transporter permease [Gammaproteobacteria bacterium]|jgi:branched-chain amino acid transport system permease protein|nr:branched-chain amino acid ABC transporter permease [Gammaproteobacteria bacterium]MBT3721978.1 branched-chain amino acid ABC transporter permease [Gammaproteobacteria bacterium]MBT4076881.1 branched-chain amino acid ABC transporter permease [Gammaproteobacteria bacterium]MBT4196783.1 branched-chain amino acid ABC transporter permease [Gammaproteobacteria bacterium]MBT4449102.1 branched-chain amino acid ABC transporter permease [Gammaproteobacteria bacterium]
MISLKESKRSALVSLWFMFLTFPIMVIKVDAIEKTVIWRWDNMFYVGFGSFILSIFGRIFFERQKHRRERKLAEKINKHNLIQIVLREPKYLYPLATAFFLFAVTFPHLFSTYQINVMTTALMYVVLGLGLNIVVGVAGLLDLGYVAFYAVGAYSYALLNFHFGMTFWMVLPLGALLAALFGVLLGFPVLRLRGDYLAIVTLAFGEIIRLVMENWNAFSQGPSGISNIPRPGLFGFDLTLDQAITYLYYLMILMVLITIFVVNRLQNSRLGRAWVALREDEIACQAMGIDKTKTKLTAFALGATWAGLVGVIFAAKTTFINPASFTFLESAIILAIVVLGGMGSILGVIIGAIILILLPEYLRALSDYRMLAFGAIMVSMMVFRPQGIISNVRRHYQYRPQKGEQE